MVVGKQWSACMLPVNVYCPVRPWLLRKKKLACNSLKMAMRCARCGIVYGRELYSVILKDKDGLLVRSLVIAY